MSRNRTIVLILAISAILSQANAASFQGVGLSPDVTGYNFSQCGAVSGDGSVAVGLYATPFGWEAFRWTPETGFQGLGDIPGDQFWSIALDVSYDGSTIIGTSRTADSYGYTSDRAFVWTQQDDMKELPVPDTYPYVYYSSVALSISADGRIITGWVGEGSNILNPSAFNRAVIWDIENDTATQMDWPYDTHYGGVIHSVDISANGSTILVGGSPDSFLWTQADGYETTVSRAMALSGDVSTVLGVGWTDDPEPIRGYFVWNEQDGRTFLGTLDGWSTNWAAAISYDGSIVVGDLRVDSIPSEDSAAYIWNEADGMRLVQDMLEQEYGLDLTGWTLNTAMDISDDGMTIVGYGINPDGIEEGWIATIPEPATIILFALGGVILRRTRYA